MISRGSSRRVPASADSVDATRIGAWLIAVLLISRVVRMFYPQVWVEDDFYLESAWLVSAGMRPYLDFVHPHMPLLEWIAAGYLKLFGASHLSIEILNEAAIFATSLLTYSLARKVAGRPIAIAASILYAYSSLVFRYHAYERESFVAPLLILGAIVTLDDAMPEMRQAVFVALIFFVACAIKLTAVIPLPVMLLFIAVAYRRIAGAVVSGIIFALALSAFSAILYRLYGYEFIFQTFVFHFLKGRDTAGSIATYPRTILDLLVPLFVLGCWRIFADRTFNRGVVLVLAIVSAEYAFYGVLSPTAWGHNYLEPLPFIAIVSGVGAMALIRASRMPTQQWPSLSGGAALIAIFLIWIAPLVNENWLHGAVYGFGFVPRAEISQLAAALRAASKPGDDVIAPSFVCFEAGRRELIRYPETYGVYREAKAEYDRDGFFAARRRLGHADFFQLISDTRHDWTEQMRDAIAGGKVSAVISDSPIQLLPLVLVPDDFLSSNGFRPVLTTDHFTLWTRTPAPAAPANE
ncbi:MAG TPA: glycosyltransferase family 39 protein [Candidatus Binatus sp.]|uniref:ArnT family glycosyltransferase n=1 Tax=Candidatus Binatus sp. TaxID=2811406 RepID=UPI002B49E0D3|nr:glycosyltransferase family 39 protein [Candidatus Binatus sp.]HKN13554.1 glycosyltransferase family 39 protein [Candidatus Binatus sp.]